MKSHALYIALLLTATTIVFAQVRDFEFVNYDDGAYVEDNARLWDGLSFADVSWAFTTTRMGAWHPVVWFSYMADVWVFGKDAGGFHLTNLLLHVANSVLLYVLLFRMTGVQPQSFLVTMLFAVHPLHVEPVAWISSRKDLLSTLFGFLAIIAYVNSTWAHKRRWLTLSMLAYGFSLMSKQMLITLPFVLILLDFWPLQRIHVGNESRENSDELRFVGWHQIMVEKAPYFLLALAFAWLAVLGQQNEGFIVTLEQTSVSSRLANAVVSYCLYLHHTIWPFRLAVHYPFPSVSYSYAVILGTSLLLIVLTVLAIGVRKRIPAILVGWLWFIGTLIPVIGIVQLGNQQMADRYTYIPLIGLFIAIAWSLSSDGKWTVRQWTVASTMILPCIVIAQAQNSLWKNSFELFQHTVEVTTNNSVGHNNLGLAYLEDRNQPGLAMRHFKKAIKSAPQNAKARVNLGNVYQKIGDVNEAIKQYQSALEVNPDLVQAHYYLGLTWQKKREFDRAIPHFRKFIDAVPSHAMAHSNLANSLQMRGQPDEALAEFKKSAQLDPLNPLIQNNLGTAFLMRDKPQQAIRCYKKVVESDESNVAAIWGLARAYSDLNQASQAIAYFKRACVLASGNAEIHTEFGTYLLSISQFDAAISEFRTVLQIQPDSATASKYLKRAIESKNKNFQGTGNGP